MNRLAIAAESLTLGCYDPLEYSHELGSRAAPRAKQVSRPPHSIFVPMHYEPGYSYPLVVWLHGADGNEQQLPKLMPGVSMRNYVAIAPRATTPELRQRNAYRWQQSDDDIERAESRVFDCIAIAQRRFNVHAHRVFLAGYGCGGTMAVRIAWSHPDLFAGVASIGGALPGEGCPMSRINELRRLPCLLATTQRSAAYPEHRVCSDLRLLHSAGCTVALRQYPGGDDLTTCMLADLNRWMMDIVCESKQ